ncbi:hypothetical protein HJG60_009645 [Phyllostomus discolor]|uniref:Uncharacterized protein n=1 Tax=Phyllostomus discolor TaxID=89673 RepID=A0A834B293_9CHIR|nr:hypothetical protein HJG60_009645 [Phyllostomus discolor]
MRLFRERMGVGLTQPRERTSCGWTSCMKRVTRSPRAVCALHRVRRLPRAAVPRSGCGGAGRGRQAGTWSLTLSLPRDPHLRMSTREDSNCFSVFKHSLTFLSGKPFKKRHTRKGYGAPIWPRPQRTTACVCQRHLLSLHAHACTCELARSWRDV